MSSSRLPGKVLAPVLGVPMILRQIERLKRSTRLDEIVVATSTDASDDGLCQALEAARIAVFRGPLDDVLARFVGVLDLHPETRALCRLTADCPLTDWRVLDELVDLHLGSEADYTRNTETRTFPHGLDVEAVRPQALRLACAQAASSYEREHVTPFLYQGGHGFRTRSLERFPSLGHLRWTVDHPEDLEFVRHVYETLYPANPAFVTEDVVGLAWNSSRHLDETRP